jgi:hypothetical protein
MGLGMRACWRLQGEVRDVPAVKCKLCANPHPSSGLPQARSQLEASQAALSEAKSARAEAAAQLAAKDAAVEALTTLSLRGDATVQEYMSSVKVGVVWEGRDGCLNHSDGCKPLGCQLFPC